MEQILLHPRFNFCSKCLNSLYSPLQYIDCGWLSQDNWMDWACVSLRTKGLHPTPLDNQSVTCTHFAQPNQDWSMPIMYLWYVYAVWQSECTRT